MRTGSFSLSGVGTITEDGNRAFGGNYGPDNNTADRLDVHGTTVPGLCVGGELGELARTAPASGAAADTDTGGDTDTQGETAEQSGAPALDVAPAPQPSSGGAQQASAPRASTSATGYAAQSAPAASNGTCTADGALGVADARLGWGVKDSFRTYIRSSTAKGGWTTSGGAVYNSGAFVFSGSDGAVDTASGQGDLRYGGSVNFTGHGGVLDLTLADPEVQFSGGTGALIANVTSNDTEGARRDLGRITVADLAVSQNTSGDVVDGTASATLTAAGASAMSDFYPAGTEMAPVTFRASLAGTATCAEAAGTRASSAAVSGGSGASAANALKKGGSDLGAMPADETDAAKDDASAKRSATSLLGEEAADTTEVDDRSIALALASNAGVPVALALLIIAAGALGYVIARNRRTGGMTADAGADGKSAARPGHDEQ